MQKKLSRRQARWMEFLSQYDAHFVYVRGEQNSVADALSRRPLDNIPSLVAEKGAQQPYSTSLTDDEDSTGSFSADDGKI